MSEDTNALAGSETPASTPTVAAEGETPEVKTEDAAEAVEGSSEPDDKSEKSEDAKEDKPKPKSRAAVRLEEVLRAQGNLKRQNTRLIRENERLRQERAPQRADFADEADFDRANVKRASREATVEQQSKDIADEWSALKDQRNQAWAERLAESAERFPDLQREFNATPINEVMADLIVESDVGLELAQYLSKNKELAGRIYDMSPVEAARELGRLEGRVSPPKTKTFSSAPKPVPTVSGKSSSAGKSLQDMDYEAYKKARMAQIKAKREGG